MKNQIQTSQSKSHYNCEHCGKIYKRKSSIKPYITIKHEAIALSKVKLQNEHLQLKYNLMVDQVLCFKQYFQIQETLGVKFSSFIEQTFPNAVYYLSKYCRRCFLFGLFVCLLPTLPYQHRRKLQNFRPFEELHSLLQPNFYHLFRCTRRVPKSLFHRHREEQGEDRAIASSSGMVWFLYHACRRPTEHRPPFWVQCFHQLERLTCINHSHLTNTARSEVPRRQITWKLNIVKYRASNGFIEEIVIKNL